MEETEQANKGDTRAIPVVRKLLICAMHRPSSEAVGDCGPRPEIRACSSGRVDR